MSAPASDVTRRRILLVDDDPTLRETLAEQLGFHEEYTVGQAENGAEAIKAIDADHFDAIVLDVGLPDMDGRDLCKLMRRRGVKAPIIMLTGQDSDADAILGLDARGVDPQHRLLRPGLRIRQPVPARGCRGIRELLDEHQLPGRHDQHDRRLLEQRGEGAEQEHGDERPGVGAGVTPEEPPEDLGLRDHGWE